MFPDLLPVLDFLGDSYVQLLVLLGVMALLIIAGRAVPSRKTLLLIAVPIPLAVFGFWVPFLMPIFEVYNLGIFLLLLIDRFLLSIPQEAIVLTRTHEEKLSIGQENLITLGVENQSSQRLLGTLLDPAPAGMTVKRIMAPLAVDLPSGEVGQLSYTLAPRQRGQFAFGTLYLRYASRLGLLWLLKRQKPETSQPDIAKVYPDIRRMKQMRIKYSRSITAGELQRRSLGVEGTQFTGLRSYYTGDDVRRMDWKASARLDAPIIRTFASEVDQPILVLLDAGRKMSNRIADEAGKGLTKFDWALNAALAFAGVSLERGDQVGVGVFARDILTYAPIGSRRKQLKRLLEELHAVQPQPVEPQYEAVMTQYSRQLKRRTLIVLFTDLIDPVASRSLMRSLRLFSSQHLLVVVTLSDSGIVRLSQAYPETAEAAYQKGVALDLLAMRQRALREMAKRDGAIFIDAPPEAMDERLIDRYLEIKLKNRL
jgi:uncharacterized protein (DUF58 family)